MKIQNSFVAVLVLAAIVVSAIGTMTTMNVLDRIVSTYYVVPGAGEQATTGYISGTVNVTVNESATLSFVVSEINMTLNTRESGLQPVENNTADDDPTPFIIRNDGSTNVNVTIYTNGLWTQATSPTEYFTFKCRHNESYCDNSTYADKNSTVDWDFINLSGSPDFLAFNFSYLDGTAPNGDEIKVDINVTVPPNEGSGEKISTITITASTACPGDANCDSF